MDKSAFPHLPQEKTHAVVTPVFVLNIFALKIPGMINAHMLGFRVKKRSAAKCENDEDDKSPVDGIP